jgi:hypothetical protein
VARDVVTNTHPLLAVLLDAARDVFPAVDGRAVLVQPLDGGLEAVVSFTGHAVLATSLPREEFPPLDGFGDALRPAVLSRLAGADGEVNDIDVTLAAFGHVGGTLAARVDLDDHPRVLHARHWRADVRVFGDDRGLVTVSRGLAGRTELSVETSQPGVGRALIADALGLVAAGEPVFAAVAPGNARSLRAFLAAGFRPVASEVLIKVGRLSLASARQRRA